MKLKKIIASVSAAAMVMGCMPAVWADGTSDRGVSVLPEDFEPVTYSASEITENGYCIVPILDPYNEGFMLTEEIDLPQETKDISICFDVRKCDTVLSVWGAFLAKNGDELIYAFSEFEYEQLLGDFPQFDIDESGSYELIVPTGLLLEKYDFEYLEYLSYLGLYVNGQTEDSEATITITDIKSYQKSHTLEECVSAFKVIPEPDEVVSGEIDGFQYENIPYGPIRITGYTGKDKDISIPEEIEGKRKIEISYTAFENCTFIETVKLSSSVVSVDGSAFSGCTSLKAINVDKDNANYSSAEGVLFDKDKTTLLRYPSGKTDKSYSIPEGVTLIEYGAFEGCSYLTSAEIPDSVTWISMSTFSGCTSLTSVKIPDSINEIGRYAFKDCTSLASIDLPQSLVSIDRRAFVECTSLTAINVDEKNTSFTSADGILYNKDKTTLVIYPAGKTDKTYYIPDGVKAVGYFSGNKNLTSVIIPESAEEINGSFENCSSLTAAVFLSDTAKIPGDFSEKNPIIAFDGCSLVTIYGHEGSEIQKHTKNEWMINLYTSLNGKPLPFKVLGKEAAVDTENGIILENPNLDGTTLTVIVADGADNEKITYNITLKDKDGKEIQPEGNVTVKIPLPEGWDGEKTIVSRHETDGTYTNMKAKFENSYLVFVTEHFSEYVLSLKELEPDAPAPNVTTTTNSGTTSDDENKPTGFAIAIVPVIAAGAAVVIFSKKRK